MSAALLAARLILGLGIAAHGAQKLFAWFGGHGPQGTGSWMESLGYHPGVLFAVMAGLGEFLGGNLVAAGLLGGLGPALIVTVMIVAILTVHIDKGFFNENKGWELPAMYIAGAVALSFAGFGKYSVDHVLGPTVFSMLKVKAILIGAAVVLGVLNAAVRRRKAPTPA